LKDGLNGEESKTEEDIAYIDPLETMLEEAALE